MTPSDQEIHEQMEQGYRLQQAQAKADQKRRHGHFQVRLPDELAAKLQHFMNDRDLNANQALNTIVSKFFH